MNEQELLIEQNIRKTIKKLYSKDTMLDTLLDKLDIMQIVDIFNIELN
jgi:hypothetical protein